MMYGTRTRIHGEIAEEANCCDKSPFGEGRKDGRTQNGEMVGGRADHRHFVSRWATAVKFT
jgi:hypothetical protein